MKHTSQRTPKPHRGYNAAQQARGIRNDLNQQLGNEQMNRYLFSLLAAAVVAAPVAHAQTSTKPMTMDHGMAMHEQHADSGEHAKMMATLNLTDAQKTQIKAIHAKYEAQMKGTHDGNMAGMAGMGKTPGMDKMMVQEMADVRAVLTPDQQKQFDTMMAEHKKEHEAKAHHKMNHGNMKMPMGSMPGMSH